MKQKNVALVLSTVLMLALMSFSGPVKKLTHDKKTVTNVVQVKQKQWNPCTQEWMKVEGTIHIVTHRNNAGGTYNYFVKRSYHLTAVGQSGQEYVANQTFKQSVKRSSCKYVAKGSNRLRFIAKGQADDYFVTRSYEIVRECGSGSETTTDYSYECK